MEESWGSASATNQTAEPKPEIHEGPLHASSWQKSSNPAMKLEDSNVVKGYDSIKNSFTVPETDVKLYKYRFWILSLFSVSAIINGVQWGQYTIMADVNKCFYDVNIYVINWTANIFAVLYIPLGLPVSWLVKRYGIRIHMLISTFFSCSSAGIQCLTLKPDTFSFVMLSQSAAAVTQAFILSASPHVAALWFGPEEMSSAYSTGVAANMIGIALGFLLTPIIVPHDCSVKSDISNGKRNIAYSLLIANLILFALLWATFKEKPEKPPSLSQANKLEHEPSYKQSLRTLCKMKNFMLLSTSYGIFFGATTAVRVIFNFILLPHFPGKYVEIGFMSLTAIIAGIVGCSLTGLFLDKTHALKQVYLGLNISLCVVMVTFLALLETKILWIQCTSSFILGLVADSHYCAGLEFASEITFPEQESIVAYLMNAAGAIFTVILTMLGSWLQETYGIYALFSVLEIFCVLGSIITVFTKCESRRSVRNRLMLN